MSTDGHAFHPQFVARDCADKPMRLSPSSGNQLKAKRGLKRFQMEALSFLSCEPKSAQGNTTRRE